MSGSQLSTSAHSPHTPSRNPSGDGGFFHAETASGLVLLELRSRQAVRWALVEPANGVASFTRMAACRKDVAASVREQLRDTWVVTEDGAALDWSKAAVQSLGSGQRLHGKLEVQDVEAVRLLPLGAHGAVVTLHGIIGVQDLAGTGRLCAESRALWQAYWEVQP